MTQEQIFNEMMQHYQEKGIIMGPREFISRFQDAKPEDIVSAILQFDAYLDEMREAK